MPLFLNQPSHQSLLLERINMKQIKKIEEGVIIGGFSVSSPWDEEVPLKIEEAIVRNIDGELWAEHIKPQYDYTEVEDNEYWRGKIIERLNSNE